MIEIRHRKMGAVLLQVEGDTLRGVNLGGADLRGADLTDRPLLRANLARANLAYAKLDGALLEGTILTGALYNKRTRWPAGFDPQARGAVLLPKLSVWKR